MSFGSILSGIGGLLGGGGGFGGVQQAQQQLLQQEEQDQISNMQTQGQMDQISSAAQQTNLRANTMNTIASEFMQSSQAKLTADAQDVKSSTQEVTSA